MVDEGGMHRSYNDSPRCTRTISLSWAYVAWCLCETHATPRTCGGDVKPFWTRFSRLRVCCTKKRDQPSNAKDRCQHFQTGAPLSATSLYNARLLSGVLTFNEPIK